MNEKLEILEATTEWTIMFSQGRGRGGVCVQKPDYPGGLPPPPPPPMGIKPSKCDTNGPMLFDNYMFYVADDDCRHF